MIILERKRAEVKRRAVVNVLQQKVVIVTKFQIVPLMNQILPLIRTVALEVKSKKKKRSWVRFHLNWSRESDSESGVKRSTPKRRKKMCTNRLKIQA